MVEFLTDNDIKDPLHSRYSFFYMLVYILLKLK